MRSRKGRSVSTAAGSPDTIIARVPARAPAGPPLIGESTIARPRCAKPSAMRCTVARPMVDISAWMRMALPWTVPSGPSAAASLILPVGRQTKTMLAALATSVGEVQALAPRATKGAMASARGS